jgi:ABC-2 type transport system ATP-binding protein
MMIETRGLCKSFGEHVVLDGIDLDVAEGTILALLGPNGAGKTTKPTYRMLDLPRS